MRDIVIFLLILTGIFFAIGEWRGWYLGIPNQTPIFLYKNDHVARTPIRTVTRDDMPIAVSGQVRRGTVRVQVLFESPASFQTGAAPQPQRGIFDQTFTRGQRLAIDEVFREGRGIYTVVMTYADASGTFRISYPVSSQL
jgi:hypothetical protein